MGQELPKPVIAITVVILVALIGFLAVKFSKPAYYIPSPGTGGRPAATMPDYSKHEFAPDGRREVPPAGSIQGNPNSIKQ